MFSPLAPEDYTAVIEFPVIFESSDTSQCDEVPITVDTRYELDEMFTAVLTTTDPGVVLFNDTATATIIDDDSKLAEWRGGGGVLVWYSSSYVYFSGNHNITLFPLAVMIDFNPTSYTVVEGGVAMLRIVKIGDADYPVSVDLSTVDGSAVGKSCLNIPVMLIYSSLHVIHRRRLYCNHCTSGDIWSN